MPRTHKGVKNSRAKITEVTQKDGSVIRTIDQHGRIATYKIFPSGMRVELSDKPKEHKVRSKNERLLYRELIIKGTTRRTKLPWAYVRYDKMLKRNVYRIHDDWLALRKAHPKLMRNSHRNVTRDETGVYNTERDFELLLANDYETDEESAYDAIFEENENSVGYFSQDDRSELHERDHDWLSDDDHEYEEEFLDQQLEEEVIAESEDVKFADRSKAVY